MNTNRNIVIFLGPPGSGKGSLSKLCNKQLGWVPFSTGNACRQHILSGSELGKQIDFVIKSGKLISDALITEIVADWLSSQLKNPQAVILDGFPRTRVQASALNNLLKNFNLAQVKLDIIRLVIPDNSIINRLSTRFICQDKKCQSVYSMSNELLKPKNELSCDECGNQLVRRPDDEEESIKHRLKVYYEHERELIEFYGSEGVNIKNLEVESPIDQVFERLLNLVAT